MAQARKVLGNSSPSDLPAMVQELLPDSNEWKTALALFISRVPDPSLAITNAFGGSLSLISPTSSDSVKHTIYRDGDGSSAALRMAQYTTRMIKSTDIFDKASRERKTSVCKYMAIFLQLASDNLSVPGSMPLWEFADPDIESEIVEFVTEAEGLLGEWLHSRGSSTSEFLAEVQEQLLDDSYGLTASSYYSGRAFSTLTAETAELHGSSAHVNDADLIRGFRRSNDTFAAAAYLTSASESEELFRLCNYLLTDLTEHDIRKSLAEGTLDNCLGRWALMAYSNRYAKVVPGQLRPLESARLRQRYTTTTFGFLRATFGWTARRQCSITFCCWGANNGCSVVRPPWGEGDIRPFLVRDCRRDNKDRRKSRSLRDSCKPEASKLVTKTIYA